MTVARRFHRHADADRTHSRRGRNDRLQRRRHEGCFFDSPWRPIAGNRRIDRTNGVILAKQAGTAAFTATSNNDVSDTPS